MSRVNEILIEALKFEEGHNRRTQHILKVHSLVKLLGEKLELDKRELELLEIASILHDIGIKPTKEKGIDTSLENQLKEVEKILENISIRYDLTSYEKSRVYFLIENHHNYLDLNDLSHQILIEADLIINLFEKNGENGEKYLEYIRTDIGKELFKSFFHN